MNPVPQEKGERVRGVLMDQEDACFCLLFFLREGPFHYGIVDFKRLKRGMLSVSAMVLHKEQLPPILVAGAL